MTRETKIGLLVGLAFIIVIGILLSDHLTSSTEPPPAAIAQVGQTVRSAVRTPAHATQPPITVIQPPQVQPHETVQTANDLTPKPEPVTLVQITPPAAGQTQPLTVAQIQEQPQVVLPVREAESPPPSPATTAGTLLAQHQPAAAQQPLNTAPPVAPRQNDPVLARLNAEAERLGESIVPASSAPGRSGDTAVTRYKAEPGDTLSKIAQKAYGSSAKAYRDAIVEANPSLKANPDLVIEGRTYVIPAVRPDAATASTAAPIATTPKPTPASEAIYVVVEGDNLTRIATRELGTPEAVAAIKELNRDLLKGSDIIRPGMKLRLPAKVAMN